MTLKREEVEHIAHLARVAIAEADIAGYARDLSEILGFVEQMDRLDTDGVEPLAHPLETTQRLRDDEVTEPDQRELLQSGAPAVQDGYYLVPRVIE